MQRCRDAEMQICRHANMQRCRHAEMQICRYAEMQRCRDADMQRCRDAECRGKYAGNLPLLHVIVEGIPSSLRRSLDVDCLQALVCLSP